MKKRKFIATGGLMATMLIAGANPLFAQPLDTSKTSVPKRTTEVDTLSFEYDTHSRPDMSAFGIFADDELNDDELTESSRQILIDEGFSSSQIHKIILSAQSSKIQKSMRDMNEE